MVGNLKECPRREVEEVQAYDVVRALLRHECDGNETTTEKEERKA